LFFLLSKILSFLIRPINWIAVLLLLSLFSKKQKRKKIYVLGGVSLFLFFSNPLICSYVIKAQELKTLSPKEIEQPFDIGIILSGFSNNRGYKPLNESYYYFSGRSSNRLTQPLQLYKQGKVKQILLSGGYSNIIGKKVSESEKTKQFLQGLDFLAEDIYVEPDSRNTYENALNSKLFIEKNFPDSSLRIALFTSAFHMRRAKKCFEKVGLEVTPISVDFYQNNQPLSFNCLLPSPAVLETWQLLIKEWVGMMAYRIKGYI